MESGTLGFPQGFRGARVYRSTAQSLASTGSAQFILFDSERYSTDGIFSRVRNDRLVIPASGVWRVGAGIRMTTSGTFSSAQTGITVNFGAPISIGQIIALYDFGTIGGNTITTTMSTEWFFNAGDTVHLFCNPIGTGTITAAIQASHSYSPELWVSKA